MKANTSISVKEINQEPVNRTRKATLLHSKTPTRMKARVDATKSNTFKNSLEESEARYRRLFETAKDGILILDATTGQITDVNPFLIELLGYTHEEFLEKKLWEIGPFIDIVASQEAFEELRQKKYIRYEELPLETKRGNVKMWNLYPMFMGLMARE